MASGDEASFESDGSEYGGDLVVAGSQRADGRAAAVSGSPLRFDEVEAQVAGMPVEALQTRVAEVMRNNERLLLENEALSAFAVAHRVEDRTEMTATHDDESRQQLFERLRGRKAHEVAMVSLSAHLKYEVTMQVQIMLAKDRSVASAANEARLAELRAMLEEVDRRVADIKMQEKQFERDVLVNGRNPIPGRGQSIMSEKVQRYFEDVLRAQDNLVKKLLLKNSTMKSQIHKLRVQLKQKEEMNEVLGHIDFGQLKIENRQYLNKIEERNQELLRLKQTAGNTVLVLNRHKNSLAELTTESDKLKYDIHMRSTALSKVQAETETIRDEIATLETANARLKSQQDEYVVPSVLSYVKQNESEAELSKKVASWTRKVEIAEMALKRQRTLLKQSQPLASAGNSPCTSGAASLGSGDGLGASSESSSSRDSRDVSPSAAVPIATAGGPPRIANSSSSQSQSTAASYSPRSGRFPAIRGWRRTSRPRVRTHDGLSSDAGPNIARRGSLDVQQILASSRVMTTFRRSESEPTTTPDDSDDVASVALQPLANSSDDEGLYPPVRSGSDPSLARIRGFERGRRSTLDTAASRPVHLASRPRRASVSSLSVSSFVCRELDSSGARIRIVEVVINHQGIFTHVDDGSGSGAHLEYKHRFARIQQFGVEETGDVFWYRFVPPSNAAPIVLRFQTVQAHSIHKAVNSRIQALIMEVSR
ncbi:uncharacterized protein AMSG_12395 [Thecamonas trahens ATCC 50062]|uniref:Cilia- and flagella-associated protein 263 n=1 Tax=Thecamonas trahens ATCC 50062 TaxID=461836 RepID=A0A0L0DSG8_THETB|nr:hypothetical protein AMSG_12395 [Thecamonas trahens ATCC 50062]KNC55215.1 hypothetical protein AMSG_12395 [Thecamonas trahens ATCC 50062]|eukprot:XP_013753193.1 hypothetical protein AMSG_12395 [Thecamonas trahens ATCC 50062]